MWPNNLDKVRIPNFSVSVLAEVLDQAELDSDALLLKCGIERQSLGDPAARITGEQEIRAQTFFSQLTSGRRDLWVKVGLRMRLVVYDTLGIALATSPTLRELITLQQRYSDLDYSLTHAVYTEKTSEIMGLTFDYRDVPKEALSFVQCRDTVGMTILLHELWDWNFPFESIELEDPSPVPDNFNFNAKVLRGSFRTTWYWPKHLLDMAPPNSRTSLHNGYCRQLNEALADISSIDPFLESIISQIEKMGGDTQSPIQIARVMNISLRTLQRQLTKRNVTYRQLVNETRIQKAKHMLSESQQSIAEVAWELGYSDPSSFCQAFKRSEQLSPTLYRKSLGISQRKQFRR
jgi:AraC-like DNA-binding protein